MSSIHAAVSTPRAREMVDAVLAEYDVWLEAKYPASRVDLGEQRYALLDMREELADHLVIPVGITIASWGNS